MMEKQENRLGSCGLAHGAVHYFVQQLCAEGQPWEGGAGDSGWGLVSRLLVNLPKWCPLFARLWCFLVLDFQCGP